MAKRKLTPESLNAIGAELESFLEEFDPLDAEDAQLRRDALISTMISAGVLAESRRVKKFRLHIALEGVSLPIRNRDTIVAQAEMFDDLIDSYGGEPDESDMAEAKTLLVEISEALKSAINAKLIMAVGQKALFKDIHGQAK